MPRSRKIRQVRFAGALPEQAAAVPVTHFQPAKGINARDKIDYLPVEFASAARNMVLEGQLWKPRLVMAVLGPVTSVVGSGAVLQVVDFTTSAGMKYTVRFSEFGIHVLKADFTGWQAVTLSGAVLQYQDGDYYSFTSWANRLQFTNGRSGVQEIDFTPAVPEARTVTLDAPGTREITTFGGRLIASGSIVNAPYRVQWSVKNNNLDWAGVGSGYEDSFASPGGDVDLVYGVVPVADDVALVIRANSIWSMSVTGDVNAPFRFAQVVQGLGAVGPKAWCGVPGGIALLAKDNVYVVRLNGIEKIGDLVKGKIFRDSKAFGKTWMLYDRQRAELRLGVQDKNVGFISGVWRYSFEHQGWSYDVYPVEIFSMGMALGVSSQSQPFGSAMGGRFAIPMFAVPATRDFAMAETEDYDLDAVTGVISVRPTYRLDTGAVIRGAAGYKVLLVEVQLEYDSKQAMNVTVSYSIDGGSTWAQYGGIETVEASSQPRFVSFRESIEAESIMLRMELTENEGLVASTLKGFTVIGLTPSASQGARIRA